MKSTFLYHYFHPDDVISARLFSELATLAKSSDESFDVVAMPAVWSCHASAARLKKTEDWNGISIRRVWRPALKQSSNLGRVVNAAFMLGTWSWRAVWMRRKPREVVVVGTDPILGVLVAIPWRVFRPKAKIVHWCHDLYPEAPIAEGMLSEKSLLARFLKFWLGIAYRRCDVIADLGPCMRELLAKYGSKAEQVTLTPWSLVEPATPVSPDPAVRNELFGKARLGLLYSGNLGRAHRFEPFQQLARLLRGDQIQFCFAGRGPGMTELQKNTHSDDTNISFAGFAPESELEKRLGACDLHLVSLRPEWTGTVVPSKFFGALASGRGVIFDGSPDSAIARWIQQYQLGWVLTENNLEQVATDLRALANNPTQLEELKLRCHRIYHEHFSRERQFQAWDRILGLGENNARKVPITG